MAERRSLGNAAPDKISRLERKFRRAPTLRETGEFTPIGRVMTGRALACPRARPGQQQPVAIVILAEPVEPPPRLRLIHAGEPPPAVAHGIERPGFRIG